MTEQSKQDRAQRLNPALRAHFEEIRNTEAIQTLVGHMAQMRGMTAEQAEQCIMEIHCREPV